MASRYRSSSEIMIAVVCSVGLVDIDKESGSRELEGRQSGASSQFNSKERKLKH